MENHKKHSLGHRAFILFLSKRIKFVVFLFILTAAAFYAERWLSGENLIWGDYVAKLLALVFIGYLLFVLLHTYLEYHYYTFMFTDEAFMVTSGYMVRTEVAALYHQIQNVNINRGVMDRMSGVSEITIFMTGSEKDSAHNKIILPAVGKTKAYLVQRELLARARRHIPSNTEE